MKPQLLRASVFEPIKGMAHGFSLRHGGLSQAPFDGFNLSIHSEDDRTVVRTHWHALLTALERKGSSFVTPKQVHGTDIVEVTHLAGTHFEADGLITCDPKVVLGILVADCVPILYADVNRKVVGAVHAGWRGTQKHIADIMVQRLVKYDVAPLDLRVAMGPAIGPCCFEVGQEVADALGQSYPQTNAITVNDTTGRYAVDLWSLNREALLSAGIAYEHIEIVRRCTYCGEGLYSHRRDGDPTGRQGGLIAL